MNAVLEKEKNFVQDYKLDDNYVDNGEPEPLFDKYGNPTPETLRACRELELGLGEKMTLEEFLAELDDSGIKGTNYLLSVPGMRDKLLAGMAEPLSECISEENILRIGSHSEVLGL